MRNWCNEKMYSRIITIVTHISHTRTHTDTHTHTDKVLEEEVGAHDEFTSMHTIY